ncbi:SDR family NAD(P)-dependent oxidoreductase [Catellatospora sp. NPDC049111]|uniref:SDR family NAD(P)-dependent oxidoreductase n=1 Tax=Catellatospora sp. NPDC049111 TaxID=3155271 RepID=UPI0033FCA361
MSHIRLSTPRTALVTGVGEGIGFEVARRLADGRTTVLVHAPSTACGEHAVSRLVAQGADPGRLRLFVADFASFGQVVAMATEVASAHPRLDLLVNNAATAGAATRTTTPDGHELTFQINYLAPYLLTRLLWESLTRSGHSRVVNVSSNLHRSGRLRWGDFTSAARYNATAAYAQSKLALTVFTRTLAEQAQGRLSAVSVHPGVVRGGLMRLYAPIGVPVADGAENVLNLCDTSTPVDHGGYYDQRAPARAHPLVYDHRVALRLWRISARLTTLD